MRIIEQLVLDIPEAQPTLNRLEWERHYYTEQIQVVCKQIKKLSDHIATIKKDKWNTLHTKIEDDTWSKYKEENLMFEDNKAAAFKSMALLLEAAKEQEADLMKALAAIRADMKNYRKACALLGEEILKEVLTEEAEVGGEDTEDEHQDKVAKGIYLPQIGMGEDEDDEDDEDKDGDEVED